MSEVSNCPDRGIKLERMVHQQHRKLLELILQLQEVASKDATCGRGEESKNGLKLIICRDHPRSP